MIKKKEFSSFGEIVNSKLIELNMTQKKLAEIIGTSEAYLSMILRGERSGKKYMEEIIRVTRLEENAQCVVVGVYDKNMNAVAWQDHWWDSLSKELNPCFFTFKSQININTKEAYAFKIFGQKVELEHLIRALKKAVKHDGQEYILSLGVADVESESFELEDGSLIVASYNMIKDLYHQFDVQKKMNLKILVNFIEVFRIIVDQMYMYSNQGYCFDSAEVVAASEKLNDALNRYNQIVLSSKK
ncbi:transcriptional regulator with XRE-family HTH domain [Desulfitispora alkaliphila]|uniref:helix-turn-helix domain-containing protein n=1 Tax=Desulfitispora alkaliphila TaxID=622674 RepID=UPI003D191DA2